MWRGKLCVYLIKNSPSVSKVWKFSGSLLAATIRPAAVCYILALWKRQMYLFKLLNIFVQIASNICLNCLIYLSSRVATTIQPAAVCYILALWESKMYLFELLNVFVQIATDICLNCLIYLSSLVAATVQPAGVCQLCKSCSLCRLTFAAGTALASFFASNVETFHSALGMTLDFLQHAAAHNACTVGRIGGKVLFSLV